MVLCDCITDSSHLKVKKRIVGLSWTWRICESQHYRLNSTSDGKESGNSVKELWDGGKVHWTCERQRTVPECRRTATSVIIWLLEHRRVTNEKCQWWRVMFQWWYGWDVCVWKEGKWGRVERWQGAGDGRGAWHSAGGGVVRWYFTGKFLNLICYSAKPLLGHHTLGDTPVG